MVLSPETVRYPHAREPRPQDLHHLRGPAPIDGGPLKTHNPDPYPLDPLPRLIGVHRHRQIPGHPKQLCHLPRDTPADASGLPPAPSPSAAPVADDTGRGWRDRTRFGKCHRTPTPTGRIGSSPTEAIRPNRLHSMAMLCIAMHSMAVPVGGRPPACPGRDRPRSPLETIERADPALDISARPSWSGLPSPPEASFRFRPFLRLASRSFSIQLHPRLRPRQHTGFDPVAGASGSGDEAGVPTQATASPYGQPGPLRLGIHAGDAG
jgi:hypothetical protein